MTDVKLIIAFEYDFATFSTLNISLNKKQNEIMIVIGAPLNPFGKRKRIAHNSLKKDFTVPGGSLASLQVYLKDKPKFAEYAGFVIFKDSAARRNSENDAQSEKEFAVHKITITYNVSTTQTKQVEHKLYVHTSLKEVFPILFEVSKKEEQTNVTTTYVQFDKNDPVNVAGKLILLHEKGTPIKGIVAAVSMPVLKKSLNYISEIPVLYEQVSKMIL